MKRFLFFGDLVCVSLTAAAALMLVHYPAAAKQESGIMADATSEYKQRVASAVDFLDQVNVEFNAREVVRDIGRLDAPKVEITKSLISLYALRPDLRSDVRELGMRLATFHDLPDEMKEQDTRLSASPNDKLQRLLLDAVVKDRIRIWKLFDGIDERFGPGDSNKSSSLMITELDRGWRPSSPADFVVNSDEDSIIVVNLDEKGE